MVGGWWLPQRRRRGIVCVIGKGGGDLANCPLKGGGEGVGKGKLSGEVEVFVRRGREAAAGWVAATDAGGGGGAVARLWVEEWSGGSGGRRCYGGGGGGDQEPSGVCIPGSLQAATKTGIALREPCLARAGSAALGPTHSVANHLPPIHIVPLYTNELLLQHTSSYTIFDFILVSSLDCISATRHHQCKAMMTLLQRVSPTKLHSLHAQGT
jgi:hypothetical protein